MIEVAPRVELVVEDLGGGRPVVLVHGWGLSHVVWDRQVGLLLEHGRRVITLDMRGHGASSKPADGYEAERLGQDITAVLDELDLHEVDLVRWSLGGLAAFSSAAQSPERLSRLVLVASNGVAAARKDDFPFGPDAASLEEPWVQGELDDRLAFRRSIITQACYQPLRDDVLDWLVRTTLEAPSSAATACLRTQLRTDQASQAAGLRVPVIQILGADDHTLSKRGADWLARTIPVARQLSVAEAGHYPMIENPTGFNRALLAALGG
jgi:pimeloyl-ACP methyl ester carboxylesterase